MYRFLALLFAFCFFLLTAKTQVAAVPNPSFEGTPSHSKTPPGWTNCGPLTESPPDILPEPTFQVTKVPFDGKTYVGLVTRDNDTWESIGAQLSTPLQKDKCYRFQIGIAQSTTYYSVSRAKRLPTNFISPVRLFVWAGNDECGRDELLAQTAVIDHYNWKLYSFNIRPIGDSYTHLILEVFYADDITTTTNGNLLLDSFSPIVPLEGCEDVEKAADLANPPAKKSATQLELPPSTLFANKRRVIRRYLDGVLSEIQFYFKRSGLELAEQQFQLTGAEEIREGSPQVYAIQHALQHFPEEKWILVVRDENERRLTQKVQQLAMALSDDFPEEFSIQAYSPDLHRKVKWLAAAEAVGLYLLAVDR